MQNVTGGMCCFVSCTPWDIYLSFGHSSCSDTWLESPLKIGSMWDWPRGFTLWFYVATFVDTKMVGITVHVYIITSINTWRSEQYKCLALGSAPTWNVLSRSHTYWSDNFISLWLGLNNISITTNSSNNTGLLPKSRNVLHYYGFLSNQTPNVMILQPCVLCSRMIPTAACLSHSTLVEV